MKLINNKNKKNIYIVLLNHTLIIMLDNISIIIFIKIKCNNNNNTF